MDRPQSDFNMAVSYLNLLNTHLYAISEARVNQEVYTWHQTLYNLFTILITEMKTEEITTYNQKLQNIREPINTHLQRKNRNPLEGTPSQIYDELHTIQIFLMKILKDSGLLMKMKDDPNAALGGGLS